MFQRLKNIYGYIDANTMFHRLRHRCEELKRKKEEEELHEKAQKEGDIQRQHLQDGKGIVRQNQRGSPRPETQSSDRETSSESNSNNNAVTNGVRNLLSSSKA
jgi:hypothetical protein